MKKTLFTLLAICMAFSALAEVTAVKTAESLVVDGVFTEKSWEGIPWVTGFTRLPQKDKPITEPTRFKFLADKNGIWVAIECEDDSIIAQERPHDDSIWSDDCVELFISPYPEINPDPNVREYFQFIINPLGSTFDSQNIGGVNNSKWNSPLKAAAAKTGTGWAVELYIPFASFPGCDGNAWRFLIGRENSNGKDTPREYSSYPPARKFQEMESYAKLTGMGMDKDRFSREARNIKFLTKMTAEGTRAALAGEIFSQTQGTLSLKCRILDAQGKQAAYITKDMESTVGTTPFELLTSISRTGKYTVQLLALDKDGLVLHSSTQCAVDVAPVKIETVSPFYRNTIFSKMADKTVSFNITLQVSPERLPACSVNVSAVREDGTSVLNENISGKTQASFNWKKDFSKQAPGKVIFTFTLSDGGKELGSVKETINILAPQAGNEVWFNEDRCLVLNGKLFFPNGFYGCSAQVIPILSKAGCNVVHSYTLHYSEPDKVMEFLDEAHKYGQKVMFYPYYKMRNGFFGFTIGGKVYPDMPEDGWKHIATMVNAIKHHPAFLGWYLYDEPRGAKYCQRLKTVYDYLRQIDPAHPVFGCDNSANGCIIKREHCDAHMVDIYPSPVKDSDFMSVPIQSLYNQLDSVVKQVGREGVFYVAQAFDRDSFEKRPNNYRALTYKELRCSIMATLAAGVRGMIPYKIGNPEIKYGEHDKNSGIFASPDLKIGFLEGICPELKALEAFLTAKEGPEARADNKSVKTVTRVLNGKLCVIAVNPTKNDLGKVTITWPSAAKVRLLGEKLQIAQNGSKVTMTFGGYDAHVLTDDPDFLQPISVEDTQALIKLAVQVP